MKSLFFALCFLVIVTKDWLTCKCVDLFLDDPKVKIDKRGCVNYKALHSRVKNQQTEETTCGVRERIIHLSRLSS